MAKEGHKPGPNSRQYRIHGTKIAPEFQDQTLNDPPRKRTASKDDYRRHKLQEKIRDGFKRRYTMKPIKGVPDDELEEEAA